MVRIFKKLIILSLIVGSLHFVARLAGIADLLDRYVIWVVLVICIHAFYLWGFDHDDAVSITQPDMTEIRESLLQIQKQLEQVRAVAPDQSRSGKQVINDMRNEIKTVQVTLGKLITFADNAPGRTERNMTAIAARLQDIEEKVKRSQEKSETLLSVSDGVKRGMKTGLHEIQEELNLLRLHAGDREQSLNVIQGEMKEDILNIKERIVEIKNDIRQKDTDTSAAYELIMDDIKSGFNDFRDKAGKIASDERSPYGYDNAIHSDTGTDLRENKTQIHEVASGASGPLSPDGVKNELPANKNNCRAGGYLSDPHGTSLQKQYNGRGSLCEVTFTFPRAAAPGARKVALVGDFNGWDKKGTLMNRLESGDFRLALSLESGREYRFKYLIDDERWENDWHADKYLAGPYGHDDSVLVV